MGHVIIDPPVGPYSPASEILRWTDEIRAEMARTTDEEILAQWRRELESAERNLEFRRSRDAENRNR